VRKFEKKFVPLRVVSTKITESLGNRMLRMSTQNGLSFVKTTQMCTSMLKQFNMGRALPRAQQRDTGALRDPVALSNTPGAINRRRQRQRRTEMLDGSGGTRAAVTPDDNTSILQILDKQLNLTRRLKALEHFGNYEGNDPLALHRKAKANARLHLDAFGSDDDDDEE
jgi:hypothetical protein